MGVTCGTSMFVPSSIVRPSSEVNSAAFGPAGPAEAGYPTLRLLAVVACGPRTVIADILDG